MEQTVFKTGNACPICGNVLKEGDKLTAHYHPLKDWWVIEHLESHQGGLRQSCAQAGFQWHIQIDPPK